MQNQSQITYYPLTHPQMAIWMTEMVYPDTAVSNIAATVKIKENIDVEILKKAINVFIEKNDGIRFRVKEIDGQPMQYVAEYEYHDIDFIDFTEKSLEDLYKWDEKETATPINLVDSPMYYFAVFKVNENLGGFYTKQHHMITDAWSMVLTNKVTEYYYKLLNHEEIEPEKAPSYIEYIEKEQNYIQSERFEQDKLFWTNKLSDFEEVTTLKTRKAKQTSLVAKRKTFIVPQKLSMLIRDYSEKNKISIFSMFLAALSVYIKRVTQKDEIIINTPVLNRSSAREKSIMGMFISSIPLKLSLSDNLTFKTASESITREFRECLRHQKFPFEFIQQTIREKHNFSDRISDIYISFQNAKTDKDIRVNFESRWHFNGNQVDSLGIHISDREDTGCILLNYDFLDELYYSKEVKFIHDHVLSLLWHGLDNPEKEICKLEMVSEEEKKKLLFEFNDTYADYPRDMCIHQLFEEQVRRTPENVALVFNGQVMTYKNLNEKANQLARRLRNEGVGPDSLVGLMVNRSFEMIIGILGIVKAGGAYVPIDPDYPTDTIIYMLEDSNVNILLSQRNLKNDLQKENKVIYLDDTSLYSGDSSDLENINSVKNLIYVIYTSGSTGKPKGVMIEHNALNNFIFGMTRYVDFSQEKTILSLTTMCFDIFGLEIYVSLIQGLRLVIANEEEQKNSRKLFEIIKNNNVNMIQMTPSRIQHLINENEFSNAIESVSEIMLGGESFPETLLNSLRERYNGKIYNMYGPTETTIWSSISHLTENDTVDIGKPITNTYMYVLDNNLNLVPIGVSGELFIGGDGLARGYLNNPDLTEAKFIINPYNKNNKIYKTGDLVRYYPNGDIVHLGRIDNQVKIRGFRIETGQIENCLLKYPEIKDATVIAIDEGNRNKYLCAYYIANVEVSKPKLKEFILQKLPSYMVPSCFIQMDKLPYTPNGKLDRKALAKPEFNQVFKNIFQEPQTPVQEKLCGIWSAILKLDRVGIDENFFDIGGDSLYAMSAISRIHKEFKINIKYEDFLRCNNIKILSEAIEKSDIDNDNISSFNNLDYEDLSKITDITFPVAKREFDNILLTGATGFLGSHIVSQIMDNTKANIFCLVRDEKRFIDLLKYYFEDRYNNEIGNRILVIKGDITEDKLGLQDNEYNKLENIISSVFHSAADTRHFAKYLDMEKTNVQGTKNIIGFCKKARAKMNHISTLSVSGERIFSQSRVNPVFTEDNLYIGQDYAQNSYVQSKFVAEVAVINEMKNGLCACIYRVGNLTWRYTDGKFQKNSMQNGFYNWIKALVKLRSMSEDISIVDYDLTPVDLCSEAIVKLARNTMKNAIYHIQNPNICNFKKIMHLVGEEIQIVSSELFEKQLDLENEDENVKVLGGYIKEFLTLKGSKDMTIKCEKTLKALENLDFIWPEITQTYIKNFWKINGRDYAPHD